MEWILIIMLYGYAEIETRSIEFNTKDACVLARDSVLKTHMDSSGLRTKHGMVACFPKGKE